MEKLRGDICLQLPVMVGKVANGSLRLQTVEGGSSYTVPRSQRLACYLIFPTQAMACETEEIEEGRYSIKFTPDAQGKHRLRVKVEGFEVEGSPFSVHVAPSPKTETHSHPVKVVSGLEFVYGVAVDQHGQILVTEIQNACVSIFDKEGKKTRSFGSEGTKDGQFTGPEGIAVTPDGYILVKDRQRIQKLTPEGKHIASIGSSEAVITPQNDNHRCHKFVPSKESGGSLQFCGPNTFAVHPITGDVYICDHHYIHIVNKDLNYLRTFEATKQKDDEYAFQRAVAVDSTGNVFVANDARYIDVYTSHGVYINQFGRKLQAKNLIAKPTALAIDHRNNLLYVAEYFSLANRPCVTGEHSFSVFTTEGKFIGCVGQTENGTREYRCLRDIATDSDNVYITDSGGKGTVVKII